MTASLLTAVVVLRGAFGTGRIGAPGCAHSSGETDPTAAGWAITVASANLAVNRGTRSGAGIAVLEHSRTGWLRKLAFGRAASVGQALGHEFYTSPTGPPALRPAEVPDKCTPLWLR